MPWQNDIRNAMSAIEDEFEFQLGVAGVAEAEGTKYFGRGVDSRGVMNKIIIDSLSKLPDEDLVAFVNCTPEDAAVTFAECMMQEARVVYSFTRWDGKVGHYIP